MRNHLDPPHQTVLIFVMGPPGVGKSDVCQTLQARVPGLDHVSADATLRTIAESETENDAKPSGGTALPKDDPSSIDTANLANQPSHDFLSDAERHSIKTFVATGRPIDASTLARIMAVAIAHRTKTNVENGTCTTHCLVSGFPSSAEQWSAFRKLFKGKREGSAVTVTESDERNISALEREDEGERFAWKPSDGGAFMVMLSCLETKCARGAEISVQRFEEGHEEWRRGKEALWGLMGKSVRGFVKLEGRTGSEIREGELDNLVRRIRELVLASQYSSKDR